MSLKQIIVFEYATGEQSFVQQRVLKEGSHLSVERVFTSADGKIGYRQRGVLTCLDEYVQVCFPFHLEPYKLTKDIRLLPQSDIPMLDGSAQRPFLEPYLSVPYIRFAVWSLVSKEDREGRFMSYLDYEPGIRK
jgi:hypothetical protein